MNKVIKNLSFNWAFCQQSQASLSITILNLGILFWRCLHERRHITQHNDTQHNDIQHNDTQHNDIQHNETQLKGLLCDTQHK